LGIAFSLRDHEIDVPNRPGTSRWSALGTHALRIIRRVVGSSVGDEEDLAGEDLVGIKPHAQLELHAVARERDPAR
jgi:hypothetical protein